MAFKYTDKDIFTIIVDTLVERQYHPCIQIFREWGRPFYESSKVSRKFASIPEYKSHLDRLRTPLTQKTRYSELGLDDDDLSDLLLEVADYMELSPDGRCPVLEKDVKKPVVNTIEDHIRFFRESVAT